jgi:hypothetical protein
VHIPLADRFDFDSVFHRQTFCVLPQFIAEWWREMRIEKIRTLWAYRYDVMPSAKRTPGQSAEYQNPGIAGEHQRSDPHVVLSAVQIPFRHHNGYLFGSGFAGLAVSGDCISAECSSTGAASEENTVRPFSFKISSAQSITRAQCNSAPPSTRA